MYSEWREKVAVLYEGQGEIVKYRQLAERLAIPLVTAPGWELNRKLQFLLSWREGCLALLDKDNINKHGLIAEIEHRRGEQRSWPMPKQGALAQALGKKTLTVADATAGWGQDSLAMFRMGYQVISIERSPVMAELLADGFNRLAKLEWLQQLDLSPPKLLVGDAINVLKQLSDKPDCIYLDPMFPPKRKKSALAKKSIMVLRELAGEDADKERLFETALGVAGKRVVIKSPDYAPPLGDKPNESFHGKLLRYDVYLK